MANMMEMMKQVQQLKRMQKELKRKVVAAESDDGSIRVEVRGDMSVKLVAIKPEALRDTDAARLGLMLTKTMNSALDAAKAAAADDMSRLAGGGLGGMLGM